MVISCSAPPRRELPSTQNELTQLPPTRNKVFISFYGLAKLIGWGWLKKVFWFKIVFLIRRFKSIARAANLIIDHKIFFGKNFFLGLKGTGNWPLVTRKSMKTLTKQRVGAKMWIHLQSKITKNYWKPLVKQAFVKVKEIPFFAKPWKHWGKLGILIKNGVQKQPQSGKTLIKPEEYWDFEVSKVTC